MKILAVGLLVAAAAHADDSFRITVDPRAEGLRIFRAEALDQAMGSHPSHDLPRFSLLAPGYPWHINIQTTTFWCMEAATATSPSNYRSAYDSLWFQHFRSESPFYASVPYCDIDANGHSKASVVRVPWFRQAWKTDGVSIVKDRWIEIRAGDRRAFAQIKDAGPYHVDDIDYCFGNQRPQPHENNQAGLDVSPKVQEYLGLRGLDVCSWRWVEYPSPGPWLSSGDMAFNKGAR